MIKSKRKYRTRCRPGLGTLIRVCLNSDDGEAFDHVFRIVSDMEKIFNFHDEDSELNRLNRRRTMEVSAPFIQVLRLAMALRAESRGAFTPVVCERTGFAFEAPVIFAANCVQLAAGVRLDLGGLAKGHAVDEAVEAALSKGLSGFVEAGGDIRYFGVVERKTKLRLGLAPNIVMRDLSLRRNALAASSPGAAERYGKTNTHLRPAKWPAGTTIVVLADTCSVADGLTKAALYGDGVGAFDADLMAFDRHGTLLGERH